MMVRRPGLMSRAVTVLVVITLTAATLVSVPAAFAVKDPPNPANGTIACSKGSGALTFSPPLTNGGTAAESAKQTLSLAGCVQTGNTNVDSTAISATVTSSIHLPTNDCSELTHGAAFTSNVIWKATAPVTKLAPSTLSASGFSSVVDGTGHFGIDLTDANTTGSYAGASAVTLYSPLTAGAVATACKKHLAAVKYNDFAARFGTPPPVPVFTSPASTTFTEGAAGTSFPVTATDSNPLRFVRTGALPPGVRFVNNHDNASASLSGTPTLGTAGSYPIELTAIDSEGQVAQQAFTLTVDPIDPTLPVVTGVSPSVGAGATAVTLSGSNFTGATQVMFGATPAASFTVDTDGAIDATAPSARAGAADVTVTTPNGVSPVVDDDQFTFDVAPSAPYISDVIAEGLGLQVSWVPTPTSDQVTQFTLSARVAAGFKGTTPPACKIVPTVSVPGTDTAALVTGVCAGIPYTSVLTATNAFGTSAKSASSNPAVPLAAQPPSQPLITATYGKPGALRVEWVPPAQSGGLAVDGYTLSATFKHTTVTVTPASTDTEATITGLTDATKYSVSLTAHSAAGTSAPATASAAPSSNRKPPPPGGLRVVPDGSGNLAATWTPPSDPGSDDLTSYELTVTPSTADGGTAAGPRAPLAKPIHVSLPAATTNYTITGLAADGFYDVSVSAKSPVGIGPALASTSAVTPTVTMAGDAVTLSQSSMDAIASESNGTLRWRSPVPDDVAALTSGETIVGPTSTAARSGLLATVQSVSADRAGDVVVDTVPASLGDAFDAMSFSVSGVPPGVAATNVPVNWHHAAASVTGSVTFTPTLSMSVSHLCTHTISTAFSASSHSSFADHICVASLGHAEANASLPSSESLTAHITGPANVQLASIPFPCVCFNAGLVPVAITSLVNVSLTLSGAVNLTANASTSLGGAVDWSSSGGLTSGVAAPTDTASGAPLVNANATGTIALVIKPTTCLWAAMCGNFEADHTLSATINTLPPSGTPYFNLCSNLTLDAGLAVSPNVFVNFPLAPIYNQDSTPCFTITNPPPVTFAVTPANPTLGINGTQQFTATRSDAQSFPITWTLIGAQSNDSISATGLVTVAAPGSRSLTVMATDSTGLVATTTVNVGNTIAFDPPPGLAITLLTPSLIQVTWQAPTNTGGSPITGYAVTGYGYIPAPNGFSQASYGSFCVNTTALSAQFAIWSQPAQYTVSVVALTANAVSPPATVAFST